MGGRLLRAQGLDRASATGSCSRTAPRSPSCRSLDLARARAGEVGMRDRRHVRFFQSRPSSRTSCPSLVEHAQRLVAQFRELRAPSRPAAHRAVVEDDADDVDLLALLTCTRSSAGPSGGWGCRCSGGASACRRTRADIAACSSSWFSTRIPRRRASVWPSKVKSLPRCRALRAGPELGLRHPRRAAEQDVIGFVHLVTSFPLPATATRFPLISCAALRQAFFAAGFRRLSAWLGLLRLGLFFAAVFFAPSAPFAPSCFIARARSTISGTSRRSRPRPAGWRSRSRDRHRRGCRRTRRRS